MSVPTMNLLTNAPKQVNGAIMLGFVLLAMMLREFDPTLFALSLLGIGQCAGFAQGRGWA